MKRLLAALLFAGGWIAVAPATAQTEGTVNFTVRTATTGSNYAPRHILAVWITNGSDQFVKTLKRRSNSRQQYLYQWIADSNQNTVDGITGATLNSHETHQLVWDCTDVNHNTVADGTYRIHVEFSERNGQGPWTANTIQFTKGPNATTVSPADQTNFKDMSVVYTPSVATHTLVALGDTWRYHDGGLDLHATAWKSLAYDDAGWGSGQTRLGYGGDGETSPPLSYGSDSDNKHPCYYFRKEFTADDVPDVLILRVARDDGVVVYLNGVEVARSAMASGPTTYSQYANAVASGSGETTLFEFSVNPALIAVGRNLLAAEVHQTSGTSSDVGFNLDLKAGPPRTVPHDIALLGELPTLAFSDSLVPVQFTVSNRTTTLESFDVTLSNLTSGVAVDTPQSVLLFTNETALVTFDWDTTGLPPGDYLLEAVAGPIPGETSIADNTIASTVAVRTPVHDVAVTSVSVQGEATEGDILTIGVNLANLGTFAETFTVSLVDTNTGATIASSVVSSLAPLATTSLTFTWPTLGLGVGAHPLEVRITGVTGDADPGNDIFAATGWVRETGFGLQAVGEVGSLGGYCGAIAENGTTAALGAGARLVLLDVSTAAAPAEQGAIRLPGSIESVALSATLACTANGNSGVHLIDVTTPSAPSHVQTFDTSGFAHDVALADNLLYIADGVSGIRVLDVSNPASPILSGAYATEGPARAVAVEGTSVYVLDRNAGLRILDASTLSLTDSFNRPAFGTDLAVAGSLAYVVDQSGYLSVLDLTVPELIGRLRLAGPGQSIAVQGSTGFVAVGPAGMQVIDLTTATNPVSVVTYATTGYADGLALDTTQLWVADGFDGLLGLDVSTPASPAPHGNFDPGGRTTSVAIDGDTVFVAAGARGLQIYDLTDPASPQWIATSTDPVDARDVGISGNLACVADGLTGMVIVDIANPALPQHQATYTHADLGFARRVVVRGTRAVVTDGANVQQVDLTNPQSPQWLTTYACPGYAYDLAPVDGAVLVAAGSSGLIVLNTTNPNGNALAELPTAGTARAVTASGDRAWVALGQAGWQEFDVSNRASPVPLGTSTTEGPVTELTSFGDLLHLADGGATLTSINQNPTLTPVTTATFGLLQTAMRATADGPYLYLAHDDAGLTILDGSPDDHDLDRMADAWEQAIVDADPGDAIESVDDVLPGDDFDGDDLSNLAESIAGTDATDPTSVFAAMAPAPATGGFDIRWHSIAGKTYAIHKCTDLQSGFTLLQSNLPATPPVNTHTDTEATGTQAFYLISVSE